MESTKKETCIMKTPLVSISCITYNHAPYIRECLEGFLMQKTNFPFEILIHDDASTDGTADIIREYQTKYPDIIKPILQTENQYSKGIRGISAKFNFPRALGKYIALCEGDDFWTDPKKLQIQFDFMEAHPDYSICMHGRYILNHFKKIYYGVKVTEHPENGEEYARELFSENCYFPTQTMFIRKESYIRKKDDIVRDTLGAPMADFQLAFHLALIGNVKVLKQKMAVYRIAGKSMNHYNDAEKHSAFQKTAQQSEERTAINSNRAHFLWQEKYSQSNNAKSFLRNTEIFIRRPLGRIHIRLIYFAGKIRYCFYRFSDKTRVVS